MRHCHIPAKNSKRSTRDPDRIPQFLSNIVVRHKYRAIVQNPLGTPPTTQDPYFFEITPDSLMLMAGSVGTGTNANQDINALFESVRVRSIECWCAPMVPTYAAVGAPNYLPVSASVAVLSQGSNGALIEVSDTSLSISHLAHVRFTPQSGSTAWLWHSPGSTQLAKLTLPPGSIVDFDLELVLSDPESQVTITSAVLAGLTLAAGVVGYYALEDLNASAVYLIPVELNEVY
jgi:hypothetical protein